MKKTFLTSEQVAVVKGYLSASSTEVKPIFNQAFVDAQKHAEYVVTFAEKAKSKDFVGKSADSLLDLANEVKELLASKPTEFIPIPKKVGTPMHEKLKKEALDFHNSMSEISDTTQMNNFLQQFNVINEFETIGLFFEEDIVKLNKIYTMKEIVEAVQAVYKWLV